MGYLKVSIWEVPFCRSDRSESPALPFVAKWLDDLSPGRLSGAARLRPPHLHCCSAREWKGSKRWIEGTEVCVGYSKSEARVVSPRASLRLPTAHRCKMTVSGIPTCFCLCCVPRPCLCTVRYNLVSFAVGTCSSVANLSTVSCRLQEHLQESKSYNILQHGGDHCTCRDMLSYIFIPTQDADFARGCIRHCCYVQLCWFNYGCGSTNFRDSTE